MAINNRFITHDTKKGLVLIYDKRSSLSIALPSAEYESISHSGNLEEAIADSFQCFDKSKNQWIIRKVHYFEDVDTGGLIWGIFEFLIVYLSIPLFFLSIYYGDVIRVISAIAYTDYISVFGCTVISLPIGLLLHEFSHAIIAMRNGVFVPEICIGVKRHYIPFAYTRLVGMCYIHDNFKKAKIYYAGIGINFLSASIAFFVNHHIGITGPFVVSAGVVFALQGLFNLSIYTNSDGYSLLKLILNHCDFPRLSSFTLTKECFIRCKQKNDRWLLWYIIVNLLASTVCPVIVFIRWLL